MPLPLERRTELAAVDEALSCARAGAGRLALVEGPAGIGKSRLLAETAERAAADGMQVLRARGSELEQDFAFGVALQLFEPALARLDAADHEVVLGGAARLAGPLLDPRSGDGRLPSGEEFPLVHGLHWVVANLAERAPLVVLVDDAHWADAASLRLCAYLAQRIDELPVALVLAVRTGEPGAPREVIAAVRGHPLAHRLCPRPLSEPAVATLAEQHLGAPADPAFVTACARVTEGNPYLLTELLAATQAQGIEPTAAGAAHIATLAPESVMRHLTARLARLPDAAARLARAVGVLGDGARLRHAAALAGLELVTASAAADALVAADVLRAAEPLSFAHPLVAATVRAELPAGEGAVLHGRAAELLHADDASPERVAAHLVLALPGGRAWGVGVLRAAAERAVRLGAPATAAAHLRRALEEPPAPEARGAVLLELGRAEALAGEQEDAGEHLELALGLLTEPAARAEALRELARLRLAGGDLPGARERYDDALAAAAAAGNGQLDQLRAESLTVAALDPASRHQAAATANEILVEDRDGADPGERALLATVAFHEAMAGAPRDRLLALVDRALGGRALLDDQGAESTTLHGALFILFAADELERVDELCGLALAEARARGSVGGFATISYGRVFARLHMGRIPEAVADAEQAIAAARLGAHHHLPGAYGALVHALLDAGDVAEADRRLGEADELGAGDALSFVPLLDARGRVRMAQGRLEEARDAFLAAGDALQGVRNPVFFANWRSNAALALARLGDAERGRSLAQEELDLARAFGAARPIAVALRAVGVIAGGEPGVAQLRASVDVLEGSPARLERTRTLIELGGALRRAGRRREAGAALGEGLELARAMGAEGLAARAIDELDMSGGTTRRAAGRGRDALSPAELRVAGLAAEGLSNREIAEELFVTRKAVEFHLRNTYAKLRISSRNELSRVLGA